ncbi:hypothetical protein [Mycobacteroides salmoniphilum]|uniref:hypothetical protein n=1 Tax=Mycobacteroides salmoniphilum TaxID=404941 RepID=UPI0009919F71|nr:hypothetical protein [Mycobacteroides salmoniphilum]
MKPEDMRAVAVVNGDDNMVAIWHVATEPVVQTSRLCGAWVTDDRDVQQNVVAARKVLLLDEPSDYVRALLTHVRGVIDLKATLIAIEQYTADLDEIHRTTPTPKGSQRAPISWPALTQVPDWNVMAPMPVGVVQDPLIRSTIALARRLACLADIWSAIETIRTSKSHLSIGAPSPLPLPLVTTKNRPKFHIAGPAPIRPHE